MIFLGIEIGITLSVRSTIVSMIAFLYLCFMGKFDSIEEFLNDLKLRLQKEMPRIRKEIQVYEDKLSKGRLTEKPVSGPQFNG